MLVLSVIPLTRCSRCGVRKAADLFWKRKGNPRSECKSCTRSDIKRDRDRIREYERYYRNENAERIKQKMQAWYENNPSAKLTYGRNWRNENKAKGNSMYSKRRALKLYATPSWADLQEIARLYALADQLTKTTGTPHQVDHIVPLQSKLVCGLHCQSNMTVITAKENISKGNRRWPDMP